MICYLLLALIVASISALLLYRVAEEQLAEMNYDISVMYPKTGRHYSILAIWFLFLVVVAPASLLIMLDRHYLMIAREIFVDKCFNIIREYL